MLFNQRVLYMPDGERGELAARGVQRGSVVSAVGGKSVKGRTEIVAAAAAASDTCSFVLTPAPRKGDRKGARDIMPVAADVGARHTLLVTAQGAVYAQGLNDFGQLGYGVS